jgi:hypothetical protein
MSPLYFASYVFDSTQIACGLDQFDFIDKLNCEYSSAYKSHKLIYSLLYVTIVTHRYRCAPFKKSEPQIHE